MMGIIDDAFIMPLSDTKEPEKIAFNIFQYDFTKLLAGYVVESLSLPELVLTLAKAGKVLFGYRLNYHAYLFCEKLKNGSLTKDDIRNHNIELEFKPWLKAKEIQQLICMLESHTQEKQTSVFEKLYEALVKKEIKWDYFCELAEINSRMIVSDYDLLKEISTEEQHKENEGEESRIFQINRLTSLGLLDVADRDGFWKGKYVVVRATKIGRNLAQYT